MTDLFDQLLHRLARLGAVARLQELEAEAVAIRKAFPGLTKTAAQVEEPAAATPKPPRKRRSLASRQAARARMQAFWASKRRGAAPTPDSADKAQVPVVNTATKAAKPKTTPRPKRKPKKAARPKTARKA